MFYVLILLLPLVNWMKIFSRQFHNVTKSLLIGVDHLLISTVAFTVIFGEGHPYRTRPRVMLTAGTALITVAAVGVLVVTAFALAGKGF